MRHLEELSFCKREDKELDIVDVMEFLDEHIMFDGFLNEALNIHYTRINPKTREVDMNYDLNTEVEVWLECGPYLGLNDRHIRECAHDYELDCGAPTFEDAICELALLVYNKYGLGTDEEWSSVRAKIVESHGYINR